MYCLNLYYHKMNKLILAVQSNYFDVKYLQKTRENAILCVLELRFQRNNHFNDQKCNNKHKFIKPSCFKLRRQKYNKVLHAYAYVITKYLLFLLITDNSSNIWGHIK